MHTLCGFAFVLRHLQHVLHVDAPQHQHCPVFFDLPDNLDRQVVGPNRDLARSQRAGKCARESASGRRNDIIDRRRVRLRLAHVDAVVFGNSTVYTEDDRLTLSRKSGRAEGTAKSANLHLGFVNDV